MYIVFIFAFYPIRILPSVDTININQDAISASFLLVNKYV